MNVHPRARGLNFFIIVVQVTLVLVMKKFGQINENFV